MAEGLRDGTEVPEDDTDYLLRRTGTRLISLGRECMRAIGKKRRRGGDGGSSGSMPKHDEEASTSSGEIQDGAPGELDKTKDGMEGIDGGIPTSAGAAAPTTPKLDDGTQVLDQGGDETLRRMAAAVGPYGRRPVGDGFGGMVRWVDAGRAVGRFGRTRGWTGYTGARHY